MLERFKFGICSWSLPAKNIVETCKLSHEIGLEGIELDLGKLEEGLPLSQPEMQQKLKEEGTRWQIQFSTLGANTLCDHGLSQAEKEPVVRSILETLVQTAADMAIPLVQLPSFVNGFINTEDELIQTSKNLQYVCDLASPCGITVGAENALSVEENLRLYEMVGRDNLAVYFDTSNPFWMSGLTTQDMIAPLADKICEFHVKDEIMNEETQKCEFADLGQGGSSFQESVREILKTSYQGWILLENCYPYDGTASEYRRVMDLLTHDGQTMKKAFQSLI